jgi:hypothetical protein
MNCKLIMQTCVLESLFTFVLNCHINVRASRLLVLLAAIQQTQLWWMGWWRCQKSSDGFAWGLKIKRDWKGAGLILYLRDCCVGYDGPSAALLFSENK